MRFSLVVVAASFVAAAIVPATAEDPAATMGMMEGGEVMTFMDDGHMGKAMVTDKATLDKMMMMAKPIAGCLMLMTGPDGKTYMVDTSSPEAMAECKKMAM